MMKMINPLGSQPLATHYPILFYATEFFIKK